MSTSITHASSTESIGHTRAARRRWRWLALAAVTLAAAIAGPVAAASPAAAVSGLRQLSDVSSYNSSSLKTLAIECPPFYNAIGGTANIYGTDQVRILAAVPSGAGTSGSGFGIVASEQEGGTAANWRIEGTVICAPRTSLPGLEYRQGQAGPGSPTSLTATATCTGSKKLIGMGGEAWYNNISDRSQVVLTGIRPNSANNEVTVTGYEDETGFSGTWMVYATAVCIDPVPGQQPVAAVDGYDTDAVKSASPQCPGSSQVHSLGFDLTGPSGGGTGETHVYRMVKTAGTTGQVGAVEDANGLSGSWRLRAYAICAN